MTSALDQLDFITAAVGEAITPTPTKRLVIVEPDLDTPWLNDLRQANFDPTLLTTNFDAVQMLVECPKVRMVLLSQRSQMMDGIPACRLLRQSRTESEVAVVVMLDKDFESSVNEAYSAGAADVVCRPFTVPELIARLKHAERNMMLAEVGEAAARNSAPLQTTNPQLLGIKPSVASKSQRRKRIDQSRSKTRSPQFNTEWIASHSLPTGVKAPLLDTSQMKFVSPLSERELRASVNQRGQNEVLLDRVWVCPQCQALPSFRPACPCCGSARVRRDELMHHFACAFVGGTNEFLIAEDGLSCPKCCARRLMVGTDCEFLSGPWRCDDCDWSPKELEIVGHCLKCGLRFPSHQAALKDLVGHHVDGLVPLAHVADAN